MTEPKKVVINKKKLNTLFNTIRELANYNNCYLCPAFKKCKSKKNTSLLRNGYKWKPGVVHECYATLGAWLGVMKMTEDKKRIEELETELKELSKFTVERFEDYDMCESCCYVIVPADDAPCFTCRNLLYRDGTGEDNYKRHPMLIIADKWSKK